MTKTLNLALATTLAAASLFGGSAALAANSYYKGIWPSSKQDRMIEEKRRSNPRTYPEYTREGARTQRIGPANGDYYPGLDSTKMADQ